MKRDGSIDIFGKTIDVKSGGNLTLRGAQIVSN
jgi:hypothetical protein